MQIAIIGAGVIGVTTAYALARRGHQVTVVERLEASALETSRGNAGQRSYGYVYPWASPGMIKKALPWLLSPSGPLKIHVPPSSQTLRFLYATWRFANTRGVFEANKRAMLRLGAYSRLCFLELEESVPLAFDGEHNGLIDLASDQATADQLKVTAGVLSEIGIDHQWLTPQQVREYEPGLRGDAPLVGALRVIADGTGDCHFFTQALARQCEALGVNFRYNREVIDVAREKGRIRSLSLVMRDGKGDEETGRHESLEADAFVLCAGCQSQQLGQALGLNLPIYPIKGYSLTASLKNATCAPHSTVIDDRYKVAMTRLGDRLRATGFVELSGLNRNIPLSRLDAIRQAVESRFPGAAELDQAESWCGFRPMTPDGPPIIGQAKRDNLYFNTGHGTFGWTLSAASAELIGQLVEGDEPAMDLTPFHPGRFSR